jgi:hypothetical protein
MRDVSNIKVINVLHMTNMWHYCSQGGHITLQYSGLCVFYVQTRNTTYTNRWVFSVFKMVEIICRDRDFSREEVPLGMRLPLFIRMSRRHRSLP